MKKTNFLRREILRGAPVSFLVFAALVLATPLSAEAAVGRTGSLTITNEPLPAALERKLYSRPFEPTVIQPSDVMSPGYYAPTQTVIGRKVDEIRADLFALQGKLALFSSRLSAIEDKGRQDAATYYANLATINTQLQSGTTPGNPRLTGHLNIAQTSLEELSANITALNDLSVAAADSASLSALLLDNIRAAYTLSGAVEEDHVHLAQLEEAVSNTAMSLDRVQNDINDNIARTTNYLRTEQANIRTVALAVRAGSLAGANLANSPFAAATPATVPVASPMMATPGMAMGAMPQGMMAPATAPARPLVKIRFDHSNVDFEQPVYMAVSEALARYPNARFELVAVHPSTGNAAKQAIESTRARRNAEQVLRSLTDMGLTMDRIHLSYAPNAQATTSEVHLYVR